MKWLEDDKLLGAAALVALCIIAAIVGIKGGKNADKVFDFLKIVGSGMLGMITGRAIR